MKKIILNVVLAFLATSAFSQFSSVPASPVSMGKWMVGGNIGFTQSKYGDVDNTKVTFFDLNPNVGYFFINNLAGGLRFSFISTKHEDDDDATINLLAAPFVRYYFLPAVQKVNVFLEGHYGIGSVGSGDKESYNQFGFMAGPAVFITPHTALEFGLFYNSDGGDAYKGIIVNGDDKRFNAFGINIGFQIHLGGGGGMSTGSTSSQ